MTEKTRYQTHLAKHAVPIFFEPWWLDAVCGPGNWHVKLSENPDGGLEGVMVYRLRKKLGMTILDLPFLTPYTGPYLFYPDKMLKKHARYAFDKRVLGKLLDQLPQHHFFFQKWHPSISNALAPIWSGFRQSTGYTYRVHCGDLDAIYADFHTKVRTNIKKASERLQVEQVDDPGIILSLVQMSREAKSEDFFFGTEVFQAVERSAKERNARRIYIAKDSSGKVHAGIYMVHDDRCAYYLTGGSDPDLRNSGGVTLCLWQAIQDYNSEVPIFDFEGSVFPELEKFFRSFGGELTPVIRIHRAKNKFWKIISLLRGLEYFK